jgi:hypothetical protein
VDPLSLAFLGVIAAAAIVQAVFLIAAWGAGQRALRRLDGLGDRATSILEPALAHASRLAARAADCLDRGLARGRVAPPRRPATGHPHDLGRPLERWEERQQLELHPPH